MDTLVKICGIKDQETLKTAIDYNADFVGLVFYPPSPRSISLDQAVSLSKMAGDQIKKVGLFVNPDDQTLSEMLKSASIDIIQLHGNETINRTLEIKEKFNRPIIKACPIAIQDDLKKAQEYEVSCDWLLFDAKPKKENTSLPGGNGLSFNWAILENYKSNKPWMLSGGLTPNNIQQAIDLINPPAVDVSSGVEIKRGVKDHKKIKAFLNAVKA